MQALYAQRNIAANAQRKYIVSYTVVKQAAHKDEDEDDDEFGGRPRGKGRRKSKSLTIVPSNPVELKDVLLYAPSPSGRIFECSFHKLQHMLEENARLSPVALLLPAPAAASLSRHQICHKHDFSHAKSAGQKVLVVRAGKEATSGVLEIWDDTRVVAELQVPAKLHGSIFNDGWFSHGASWDPSEGHVAYVAEVRVHGKLMKTLAPAEQWHLSS